MLQIIIDWWQKRRANKFIKFFLSTPIGYGVSTSIWEALHTDKTYLGKFLSQENKSILFNQIMSDICLISISDDPLMECRKYICNYIDILACFVVPTICPPPKDDYSNYRGMPGITGEIFNHIHELVIKDERLKKYIWSRDVPNKIKDDPDYPYEAFLRVSSEAQLHINAANILRIHLNDYKPEPERDWLHKYIEIECALYEDKYRKLLGLNDVLKNESPLGSSALIFYPVFYHLIVGGKEYPRFEWEEMLANRVESRKR